MVSLFLAFTVFGQDADKVKGYWLTAKKTSQVQIYLAKNGKYYGKICWLEEPNEYGAPKKDKNNPDPALKEKGILDLLLLKGFEYNPSQKYWEKGTIYDPDNGKTYDCYMWFDGNNYDVLKIKGYVMGMKFIGRETEWIREPALRPAK